MAKFLRLVNGVPKSFEEAGSVAIYDESLTGLTTTAGNPITLPASGTYQGGELEVRINGIRANVTLDYNYVGAGPTRTQITLTFDLEATDVVRFRVDRAP